MKVGVIGAGRLGLSFALVCDRHGIPMVISDSNETYRKNLKNGICITNEPQISEMFSKKRFLEVVDTNQEVVKECEYIWTFVETPSTSDGTYDITKLWSVVDDLVSTFKDGEQVMGKTFIVGCTTNPGDVEQIAEVLNQYSINVIYNPEFVAQGEIVKGIEEAKMVLIGCPDGHDLKIILNLYRIICGTSTHFNVMSYTSAELTKIAINCFLTTKISFANMIGEIAIKTGVGSEVSNILKAVGSDPRIGNSFLKYGFGFGGPCLPRDNRALSVHAKKHGGEAKLSDLVDSMNNEHTEFLAQYYSELNPDKSVPFVMRHISYKRGTDILTDSQQYNFCLKLLERGYTVYVQEIESVIEQFKKKDMSEIGSRLKFFRYNTKPEGFQIEI